jgi:hypothetical protein
MENSPSISVDSISDPSSTPSESPKIFPWEKLPFEIRDQIFAKVDSSLQWFSKHNSRLFLHEGSGFDISGMTNIELEGICSVSVELA